MQGDYRRFSVRSGSARPYPAETHTPTPTQFPRGAHHNAGLAHQGYRLEEPLQPSPWTASNSPPMNHHSTGGMGGSPQYQRLGASPNSRSPGISASARRQDSASLAPGRGRSASISSYADPFAMGGGHSPTPQQPPASFLRPPQSHYESSPPPGRPTYQPLQPQALTARGVGFNGNPSQSQDQASETRTAHLLSQPSWLRQGQPSNFGPTPSISSPQPLRPNSQRQPIPQQNHGHYKPVTTDQFRAGLRVIEYDSRDDRTPVRTYTCGELLGKGAFAKVFEMIEDATGISYAVKVVEKRGLTDESKKNKLLTEIRLHKRLKHKNVLNFVRYFQDEHFHYLVLERCLRYSLMEFNKDGYKFSVPEAQFILLQLIDAVSYLHSQNVIHRDLKLGNVLIDPFLNAKVGDFGLATELTFSGQRKWTRCGTPNYIAPEVLNDEGYGFACDIWSLGVLLYTLLVGIPPFETNNLQVTYQRIRQGHYIYPSSAVHIPQVARSLIASMLQVQPDRRPQLVDIRLDPFFRGAPRIAPASLSRGLPTDDVNLVREASSRPPMATPLDGFSPVHDFPGCDTPTESLPTPTFDAAMHHGTGSHSNARELSAAPIFPSASHPNTATAAGQAGQPVRGPQYDPLTSRSNSPLFDALPEPVTLGRNVMHPIHSAANSNGNGGGLDTDPNKVGMNGRQTKEGIPAPKPLLGTPRPSSQPQSHQNDVVGEGSAYSAMPKVQQLSVRQANLPSSLNQKDLRKPRNGLEGKPCNPLFVTRVLDYTRKYGVGCELSDGSISATYNDRTKLLWKLSNYTAAYYCRLPRPPSLEACGGDNCTSPSELHDILHDAFMVTEDGELRIGDPQAPQERQTRKKMTLAKYFKTCIDGSLLKERTAIVNLFPPANRDPTAIDRERGSNTRMSNQAAASCIYIKSVNTVVMRDFDSVEEWQRSFWCSTTISPNGDSSDVQMMEDRTSPNSVFVSSTRTFNFLVFRFSDQSAQICFEPGFFASDGSMRPEGIRYLCSCEENSAPTSTTQTTSRSSATTSTGSSSGTGQTSSTNSTSGTGSSSVSVESSTDALDDLRHSLGSRHMGLSLILSSEAVRTETELFPTTPFRALDGDRGAWIAISASAPVTRCGEGHPANATPGPSSSAVHPAQFVKYQLSELWSDRRNPHGYLLPRTVGHCHADESATFLRSLWVIANGVLAACNGVGQSSPLAGSSPPL